MGKADIALTASRDSVRALARRNCILEQATAEQKRTLIDLEQRFDNGVRLFNEHSERFQREADGRAVEYATLKHQAIELARCYTTLQQQQAHTVTELYNFQVYAQENLDSLNTANQHLEQLREQAQDHANTAAQARQERDQLMGRVEELEKQLQDAEVVGDSYYQMFRTELSEKNTLKEGYGEVVEDLRDQVKDLKEQFEKCNKPRLTSDASTSTTQDQQLCPPLSECNSSSSSSIFDTNSVTNSPNSLLTGDEATANNEFFSANDDYQSTVNPPQTSTYEAAESSFGSMQTSNPFAFDNISTPANTKYEASQTPTAFNLAAASNGGFLFSAPVQSMSTDCGDSVPFAHSTSSRFNISSAEGNPKPSNLQAKIPSNSAPMDETPYSGALHEFSLNPPFMDGHAEQSSMLNPPRKHGSR